MRLRVATYNLESFGGSSERAPLAARIAALRPKLLALSADVLCLQEVNAERPTKHAMRDFSALDALVAGTAYADHHRAWTRRESGGPYDIHNLVLLSRYPIEAEAQHLHDCVRPIASELSRGVAPAEALTIGWDRPALEARIALPTGRILHVLDVHLRAPLAAPIVGQKLSGSSWRSTQGWAEGFFASSVKRAGQALEVRLRVDQILDDDPDALLIVAGDLNAEPFESAPRILCADESDTGSPFLAPRTLVRLLDIVPEPDRFSLRYRGRRCLPDQLLASRAAAQGLISAAISNEDILDGWEAGVLEEVILGSLHAPAVVEIELA